MTADGNAATVTLQPAGLLILNRRGMDIRVSPDIGAGQAVVVTYTDPTAGDDAVAIEDAAGNETATFTTGVNSVRRRRQQLQRRRGGHHRAHAEQRDGQSTDSPVTAMSFEALVFSSRRLYRPSSSCPQSSTNSKVRTPPATEFTTGMNTLAWSAPGSTVNSRPRSAFVKCARSDCASPFPEALQQPT